MVSHRPVPTAQGWIERLYGQSSAVEWQERWRCVWKRADSKALGNRVNVSAGGGADPRLLHSSAIRIRIILRPCLLSCWTAEHASQTYAGSPPEGHQEMRGQYASQLGCVRYRYGVEGHLCFTGVELISERASWSPPKTTGASWGDELACNGRSNRPVGSRICSPVMTRGALICWLARTALMVPDSVRRRTRLSRHSRAFIAGFWVAGATFPCTAMPIRKASIFGSRGRGPCATISHGNGRALRFTSPRSARCPGSSDGDEVCVGLHRGVWLWILRRGSPIILSRCCPKTADNTHRTKLPEMQPNITLTGRNGQ
jgi:hypothetical protein